MARTPGSGAARCGEARASCGRRETSCHDRRGGARRRATAGGRRRRRRQDAPARPGRRRAGRRAGLTGPEAAAIAYAANERVEPGALVAVYDLGGGTFDTAILRKTTDGFAVLGQPAGIERLGGIDFDQAVVSHVRATLGPALDRIDAADPAGLSALARLRRECIDAKEALSSDTEVTIPVLLPDLQSEVRLTRGEFEG